MLFASVLFVVDGVFDGVYPGGPAWFTGKYENLAEIAYVFAIINTAVAIMVARGSAAPEWRDHEAQRVAHRRSDAGAGHRARRGWHLRRLRSGWKELDDVS